MIFVPLLMIAIPALVLLTVATFAALVVLRRADVVGAGDSPTTGAHRG